MNKDFKFRSGEVHDGDFICLAQFAVDDEQESNKRPEKTLIIVVGEVIGRVGIDEYRVQEENGAISRVELRMFFYTTDLDKTEEMLRELSEWEIDCAHRRFENAKEELDWTVHSLEQYL